MHENVNGHRQTHDPYIYNIMNRKGYRKVV